MPVRWRGKKATGTLTQRNESHPIWTPSRRQQSLEMPWRDLGGLHNMGLSLFAFFLNMKEGLCGQQRASSHQTTHVCC